MPATRAKASLAALMALTVLAACASIEDTLIARGYPPAYAEGYDDGCASGKAAAGGLFATAQEDQSRYQDSASQYVRGWDAGYQKCLADTRAMVNDARNRHPSRDK
jgi:hypothetical protein